MKTILTKTILSLLVLVLAAGVSYWLYSNKPKTHKVKPQRPVPMVKTIAVEAGRQPIIFEASGTVIPARKVALQSEVEGRVIEQNPELVPGGIVNRDDLIIQIEPLDYQLQISERQAEVTTAQYELEVEQGKQIIAGQEWQILEKELQSNQGSKNLALRKPHLQHSKARLEAAKSRLAASVLSEQRTTIRAPFTGLVLEETVEKGQFVGKQSAIATLVATDTFWVRVSIPLSLLDRIRFPGKSGEKGSNVKVIQENGYEGKHTVREGSVYKLLGDLDPKGRMARILITIQDPLNLQGQGTGPAVQKNQSEKILLGSFVKVRIDAGSIDDVYVIPRQALREGNRLWLINSEGVVSFREVKILWRRIDELLIDTNLVPEERIILSRLQSPVAGMIVRDESRNAARSKEIQ